MRGRSRQAAGTERERPSARDKALTWLARREQSCHELRTRLMRAGYADVEVEAALQDLAAAGYQSEERFAAMLVRTRVRQGYGPLRIGSELRTHRLDDEQVAAALAASQADWLEQACAQLRRRVTAGERLPWPERAKHLQFLARRGFSAEMATAALDAREAESPG